MPRERPEWIGKTDSTPVPARVKLRVHAKADGRCALCGSKQLPGDVDHTLAIINGGENRERNLRWICSPCHKNKTRDDVAEKSRTARLKAKHILPKPRSKFRGWRKMNGDIVWND